MRIFWLTLVFLGLGCQSFATKQPIVQVPIDPTIELPGTQSVMDLEKNALKQSKEFVEQHKEDAACAVLDTFLKKYPERCEPRFEYAELLLKLKQHAAARTQFEELLEHSQDLKPENPRMLQIHERLTDIAQGLRDPYAEHLHRGIGLYFMARKHKGGVAVGETTIPAETLLKKAQAELTQAHEMQPEEARPSWYLHGVYRELKDANQAEHFLRLAQQCARQSRLTQSERRGIELAGRTLAAESTRR